LRWKRPPDQIGKYAAAKIAYSKKWMLARAENDNIWQQ
jgi:hypothetical protein